MNTFIVLITCRVVEKRGVQGGGGQGGGGRRCRGCRPDDSRLPANAQQIPKTRLELQNEQWGKLLKLFPTARNLMKSDYETEIE